MLWHNAAVHTMEALALGSECVLFGYVLPLALQNWSGSLIPSSSYINKQLNCCLLVEATLAMSILLHFIFLPTSRMFLNDSYFVPMSPLRACAHNVF